MIFIKHLKCSDVELLLVESLVIVIFYVIFLMRYAVIIINYFGEKEKKEKRG